MKPSLSNLPVVVALAFCGILAPVLAAAEGQPAPKPPARVEVVFCLDTTGSMGGLIAAAQQKIWSIVNGIVAARPVPQIKVGLVAYRDKGDEYVTQVTDLTADLDAVHQKLFALRANGGGDDPESVNQALFEAVNKISWTPKGVKVYRVIFLVGDYPPHMDYTDDVKYPETCKAAVLKDLVINTLRCGTNAPTEEVWQDIARRSEGRYASIAQDGGVSVVSTPHDARLAELSSHLVATAVYDGEAEAQSRARAAQGRAVAVATEATKSMDPARLAVEADKGYFRATTSAAAPSKPAPEAAGLSGMGLGEEAGRADLVTAYARDGKKALEAVRKEDLPPELKPLSAADQQAFLEKKVAERNSLQKEIDELSRQRAQFIQDEIKKRGSGDQGFDAMVVDMLREQGAKRGLEYAPPPKDETK